MATGISANRLELLQIADAVAREKSIEKEIVIEAIEEAITKGARSRYGAEHDIRAHIDTKTGELTLKRFKGVLAGIEGENILIDLEGEEETAQAPFAWIQDAKLVFTDKLLKRGADARAARLVAEQENTNPDDEEDA